MAWYNRKKQNEVLPDEVQDYYKAEQRDRMGVAWLLAAGAFVLTVAIIIGLFFAGRWAYQAIFSSDPDTTSEVEEATGDELPGATGEEAAPEDEDTDQADGANATDTDDDTPTNDSDNSDETTDSTSPVTGGNNTNEASELPRTGPSSD